MLLLICALLTWYDVREHFWVSLIERCLFVSGAVLLLASAVPVPIWILLILAGFLLIWRFLGSFSGLAIQIAHRGAIVASMIVIILLVSWDARFLSTPVAPEGQPDTLLIIGDSLSTALEPNTTPWPDQLKDSFPEVIVRARPGIGLSSQEEILADLSADSPTAMVLLGGNDVMDGMPPAQFQRELNQLLTSLAETARVTYMFELPLPPLNGRYGWIQRRLAQRHDVRLIPRRLIGGLILREETTVDGIHLNQEGHNLLAREVGALLRSPTN